MHKAGFLTAMDRAQARSLLVSTRWRRARLLRGSVRF